MKVQTSAERFSSLTAMKAAHLDLIKQFPPGRSPSAADLECIETFVLRGRATGVLLDSHDHQRDAQCLLDHWAGLLAKYRRDVDSTLDEYDPAQAPDLEGVACPYPGLEAFQTQDALHFFGRSQLIEDLARRLDSERFLAIVGPSGIGKSSLILAGLVPVLTRVRHWKRSLRVVPGADPLVGIAHAVGALPGDGPGWLERRVEELRRSPDGLPALLDATGQSTIFIVDQFEETFTICDDAPTRQAFEASLVALIRGSRLSHRLLLSMRSDYEGHLTRMELLWPEFVKAKVAVLPLGPNDLRDAIEGPARQVGLKFEDGLVDALYGDVNGEAAALPLLQSILKQLWQRKRRNLVTWDEYKRLGNARIALGKTADEFYNALLPEEQNRVKRIFIRLVRPAAGQEVTSNRISRQRLARSFQDPGWLDDTLRRLRTAGLIRVTAGDTPADDEIEVAHEALVRNWPTLVDWLNQERSTMTLGRRLESRIAEWLRLGAGTAGLLDEESLAEVKRWREDPDAALLGYSDKLDRFIAASQAAIDAERQAREEAHQRELDLQKRIAMEKTLKARQWRRAMLTLAVLLVLAVSLAVAAFGQRERAEERSQYAQQQRRAAEIAAKAAFDSERLAQLSALKAESQSAAAAEAQARAERLNSELLKKTSELAEKGRKFDSGDLAKSAQDSLPDADSSLLLALAAARWIYPSDGEEIWVATGAIRDSLREARAMAILRAPRGNIVDAAFMPDGLNVATASDDGTVVLWNAVHGGEARHTDRILGAPNRIAISPDGARIAVSGREGVVLLDTVSLGVVCRLSSGPAFEMTFSPDSRNLAVVIDHDDVVVATVDKCDPGSTPTRIRSSGGIAFSGDGSWIASRDGTGTLRIWDAGRRKEILALATDFEAGERNPLAFRPDGSQLAVAEKRSINIYSTSPRSTSDARPEFPTGTPFSLYTFSDDVTALAYNQRGDLLVAGSRDGTVTVWSAGDRRQLFTFASNEGVRGLSFSPDSTRILTTGDGGTARIWSTNGNSTLLNVGSGTYHLVVSHDGSRLGVFGAENAVHVVNPQDASAVRIPLLSRPQLLALDDVSGRVATATEGGDVILYEASGREVRRWRRPRVLALAVSPGGQSIAVSGTGGLSIWSAADEQRAMRDGSGMQSIAFSPDGKTLVGTMDKTITAWDVASGQVTRTRNAGRMSSPVFSTDGQRIAVQADTNEIRVFTAQLEELGSYVARKRGSSVSFSSLGLSADWQNVVGVNATDGAVLWDTTGTDITTLVAAKAGPTEAVFLKDGRIAVLTKNGLLYALPVQPTHTMMAAMTSLGRAWSPDECKDHVPVESDFCKKTSPALQHVAEGNRLARTGDVERARAAYSAAIKGDSWLRNLVDPSQSTQLAAMTAARSNRLRASGLSAQGESFVGQVALAQAIGEQSDAISSKAISYFELAADTPVDPAIRARSLLSVTQRARAQVLVNTARFLAGRVDEEADEIAVSYLEKAKRLDTSLTFEPRREVGVLVAQKRIEAARAKVKDDPSSTLRIYLHVQGQFPELITGGLWNDLCWRGSLYAATTADVRARADAVSRACDEAVKADPTSADYADSRGVNLLLLGKGDEARRYLQAYIDWEANEVRKALRKRWLADLDARPEQNPITEQDLKRLKVWSNILD